MPLECFILKNSCTNVTLFQVFQHIHFLIVQTIRLSNVYLNAIYFYLHNNNISISFSLVVSTITSQGLTP